MTLAQRERYGPMLEAGVRIWEYQPSMMHAKTMLVDDRLVVVGSIDYDPLSFRLLEEGSLGLEDPAAAREMEALFLADLERARERSSRGWWYPRARPLPRGGLPCRASSRERRCSRTRSSSSRASG